MIRRFSLQTAFFIFAGLGLLSSKVVAQEAVAECPLPLPVKSEILELKERFACQEYGQILAATAALEKFSSEELFSAIELRAAALSNLRQLARAYLFLQQSIRQQKLTAEQVETLKLMSANILSALGNLDEDQEFVNVLTRPDSLEVNFRLAIAQQSNENWKGLTATLRRVLMMDPENVLARTLLVRTNIRKGNLAEAEKELLLIVADERIKDEEREAAREILDKLKEARSPHKWSGFLSAAIGETRNPLGISESGKAVFTAFPGQLLDYGDVVTTEGYEQGIAGVSYQYLMPYEEPEVIKIDGVLFERNYKDLNSIDLRVYSLAGAYQWKNLGHEVKLTGNHVYLEEDELLSSLSFSGSYRYFKTDLSELSASLSVGRNYFWSRADNANNQDNTGYVYSLGTSGAIKPFEYELLLKAGIKYAVSDLQTEALSKKALALDVGAIYPFNSNLIGNVGFAVTRTEHDGPDTSVSLDTREDNTFMGSLGLTAKFDQKSGVFGYLPAATLSYSKTKTDSNILNYDKTSSEWGLNLIWAL